MQGQSGGFYVIGPKRSSDPYFTADIDLITAVASQVGERSRLHVQIGLAEAEKRRAERMVSFGALARGLAHESRIRSLQSEHSRSYYPKERTTKSFRDSFGKIVLQEIGRIDQLVARLRGFAAPPIPRFRPVDLTSLLRDTLALLRGEIERAKVRIAVTGERAAPSIQGDPAQLKSLFLNILMNALEAIDQGGQITILYSNRSEDHLLVIEIADTGPGGFRGIAAEIFDTFVTTKPEGSGLGLAICRAIADAHRATIRAENNVAGPGMKVVLDFPSSRMP